MAKLTLQQTLDKSLKTAKQYVDTELAKKVGTKRSINFVSDHTSNWTSSSAMSGKEYLGGWHGTVPNSGTTGYLSFGASGSSTLDWFIDGDYYAKENKKVYHEGNKPTAADVGALPTTGGTMTGRVAFNNSGRIATFGNSGSNVPYSGIATQDNYIEIAAPANTSHNSKTGIVFHHCGTSTSALEYVNTNVDSGYFNFKSDDTSWNVRVNGNAVYHAGNKPTAADVGAVKRVNLTGQCQVTSYVQSVIALCRISTSANSANNSYSIGKISFHRVNGLSGTCSIDIGIEDCYSEAGGINCHYTEMLWAGRIRPCMFTYNGARYGGLEVFVSDAELQYIEFVGASNFDIFALDYYNRNTAKVLNQEVYDSLVVDSDKINKVGNYYFNGYKIYHEGNKPTPADIGASANGHTHTMANITDSRIRNVSAVKSVANPSNTWANSSIRSNDIILGGDYTHTTSDANIVFSSGTGKINMVIDGEFYAAEGQYKVYHAGNPQPTINGLSFWTGTQAQYNAISSKSSTTVYLITG